MALGAGKCQGDFVAAACAWHGNFVIELVMRESEETKKKRLAESLRANLRRRKVQGREQSHAPSVPVTSDGEANDDL
jgi:hypothetical protein